MHVAELFVGVLTAYALAGAVFAAAFVTLGIHRVDPVAEQAPVGFRLIVMPGVAALRAAVQPEATRALYFVARGDGSSEFSATLDEHNSAVAKYQKR